VAATARRLGIRTVAVYSDADAHCPACAACATRPSTSGVPAPREDSYLQWQTCILAAAQATGAQAIHPGYGFLSENDDFAHRLRGHAGMTFIGPPPSAIAGHGPDKSAAKALMDGRAVCPWCPVTTATDQDPDLPAAQADRLATPC
jgi:3-methylcrotonyl-CoA carboxylase alpha subunit